MPLHDQLESRGEWRQRTEWEPVETKPAYNELSCRAFSIWVRLHACHPRQLRGGRYKLSQLLRVSEPTFNRAVQELQRNGYVKVNPRGNGTKTTFALLKRLRTKQAGFFINV